MLSSIFAQMADCYRYLGKNERFRAIAYDTASKTLANMEEPVASYHDDIKALSALKGVGESIAEKIVEYLHTGTIRKFEELRKRVPFELVMLMDIKGIGPATLRLLHDKLGIATRAELISAIETGKLAGLRGFGERKITNIRRLLKFADEKKRLPLSEAERIAGYVVLAVRSIPGVQQATIAGSIRRKKATIGDIDIIVIAERRRVRGIINRFVRLPFVQEVIAKGPTKVSVILQEQRVQADLRLVREEEYGSALFYFTGSKEHNIRLRTIARQKGWKINEYGVFDAKDHRLAGRTEDEIYALFGLHYIPPESRKGENELEQFKIEK